MVVVELKGIPCQKIKYFLYDHLKINNLTHRLSKTSESIIEAIMYYPDGWNICILTDNSLINLFSAKLVSDCCNSNEFSERANYISDIRAYKLQ